MARARWIAAGVLVAGTLGLGAWALLRDRGFVPGRPTY